MARFLGTIQGQRGEASRLGSKASGLRVDASSWQGRISVFLYERNGVDMALVRFEMHHGKGTDRKIIYEGPVSGACAECRGTGVVPIIGAGVARCAVCSGKRSIAS